MLHALLGGVIAASALAHASPAHRCPVRIGGVRPRPLLLAVAAPFPVSDNSGDAAHRLSRSQLQTPSRPVHRSTPCVAARAAAFAVAASVVRSAVWAAAASEAAPAKLHVGQKLALWLGSFGLPDWLILVLISTLPVVELRGAVPVASWLGVAPLRAFGVCVAGNTAAVVTLLALLRLPPVERILKPLLERARAKMGKLADEGSLAFGLALFVGVPLPGTGGWTGAMVAHLLGMPFPLAAGAITAGIAMAGVIMTALTLAGWYGAGIALAALAAFCIGAIVNRDVGAETGEGEGGESI